MGSLQVEKPALTPEIVEGINSGKVVVSDVGPTILGVTPATLPCFLLDLARAVAGGSLHPDKVAVAVRSSGTQCSAEELGADLADALWYAWQEVEGDTSGDSKTRLADAAKDLLKEQLMTKQQLMESGEGEFLEWCGLVVSKELWRKKEIRSHTKHVYQQRKFNMLREESEGYAKLATLLNQRAAGCLTDDTVPAVLAEMKALIGYFDLDPNRCFSVLLDAFSEQPGNDAFLRLMPAFSSEAQGQMLGFHFFRCREDAAAQRPATPAPPGLYVAAAKMVREGYSSLSALMAHLAPADEELKTAYAEGTKRMAEGISRIGIISLVSAADTATAPLAPPGLGLRRDPSGALAGAGGAAGGGGDAQQARPKTGMSAAALELAAAPYAGPLTAVAAANQKLLLLAAFLQVGDWQHAQQLMRWLSALGLSDFAIFPAVGEALCALIGRELQPVYAAATAGEAADAAALALPPRLLELLRVVGQHLYHNVAVLTKLVRVLAALLAANGGLQPKSKQLHEQVLELVTQSVLPAMSLVPGNAGLVYEIWLCLEQLPYTDRFCLYADVKEGLRGSPLLTAAAKLAETEVRRILRRVTAPANKKEAKLTMKPLGRMLAKIMHAAPLAVAEQLIRQVMGMPGMVTSIVESLKYLTPMAFDVMTFAVLRQLASPKKKLKDDGVNLEEWYQWLAAFTGLLCKKHPEVEVVALLQYVANQLKSSESLDLLVLKEMVATMTGHQAVFDVSEHQLDALAGSDTLIAEVITQGEHRSSDKSLQRASGRLLAALVQGDSPEERLAMPLLVLLAQQRKLIVLQSQSTHLKLIAELYDKCQEVCTQYAEFLQHALPPEQYAALLPSMEELATEYRVDPELIFSLHRPLIRGVLPPAALAPEHEEEGEIAGGPKAEGAGKGAAADGAAAMEEDGQLEAGEVAASPAAGEAAPPPPPPPVDAAAAAERWAKLEAAVLAMAGSGGGGEGGEEGGTGGGEGPTFRGMSPCLYTTFWALQLYDLEVPVARYEATISQLRTDIRIAQGDIESAKRDAQRPPAHYGGHGGFGFRGPPPAEGPGLTVDVEQLQKDIERAQAALDKLPDELKEQQANAAGVERRLQREKGAWVVEEGCDRLPREFVQYCVMPRMLNSPADALYCARFLKKVHELDVPNFNLLTTLNYVMREFGFLVRVFTAREATNFGIFLNEVFALVERWRQADVFARECATSLTFQTVQKTGAKPEALPAASPAAAAPTASGTQAAEPAAATEPAAKQEGAQDGEAAPAAAPAANDTPEAAVPAAAEAPAAAAAAAAEPAPVAAAAASAPLAVRNVTHREFLNLCHNWQKKLTDDVFSSCLKSRDYMQAKNALLALNRCVKVYPAVKFDASKLIEQLKPIRDKDPREDLKTLARMYCTALEMQMRDRARNMVSTREEYAGLPPKKRNARPAASKGGAAAASEGKPPAAADKATAEKKEGGKEEKQDAGKADKAEQGEIAADKPAGGREAKDEVRRTSDSSKDPALPPGMGMPSSRGEQQRAERERGQQQQQERRREERGSAAAKDGPPPGFGSADKLKHAGSSTELRPTGDQAAAERDRRDRARQQQQPSAQQQQQQDRGRGGRDDRPPRLAPAGREEKKEKEAAGEQGQKEAGKGGALLRAEAAPFVPRGEGRPSSSSVRAAEEPSAGPERDAKRARREEPAAAAGSGSGRERAERGERSGRERPSAHEPAAEPPAGGKAERERPASERQRGDREDRSAAAADAGGRGGQRAERDHHERPASGGADGSRERERGERRRAEDDSAGPPVKRKREEDQPAGDRPSGRRGDAREHRPREQPQGQEDRERSRHGGGSAATEREQEREARGEGHRSRRGEADDAAAAAAAAATAGDVESARAAARAGHQRREERDQGHDGRPDRGREERQPQRGGEGRPEREERGRDERPEHKGSGAAAAAAAAAVAEAEADSDGSSGSGSDDEQSRGRRRSKSKRGGRKEKEKKRRRKEEKKDKKEEKDERKEKKHSKRDRSPERPPAQPPRAAGPRAPLVLEEDQRDSKRRRQDRNEDDGVPARLRGRLGSGGGLLGVALKELVHNHQHEQQRERHEPAAARDGRRQGRGGSRRLERGAEEEPPRQVREVREVPEGRDRRSGRSRR
ncbi:hypothetical protein ABPG75_007133 [Micractinium tetrahymenae]